MPSIKYYLRLLENTYEFIEKYVRLLEVDTALKFEHKANWNKIISDLR
jgi:DNA (cytosine-5)-methyltransferase 1